VPPTNRSAGPLASFVSVRMIGFRPAAHSIHPWREESYKVAPTEMASRSSCQHFLAASRPINRPRLSVRCHSEYAYSRSMVGVNRRLSAISHTSRQ